MHCPVRSFAARFLAALGFAAALATAPPAAAQSLGTFRWQLAPFCNVVTLHVELQGPVAALAGFDDLCGAGRAASAGTAVQNLDGTFGLSLSIHAPDGFRRDVLVTLDSASLSGPWRDSTGLGGSFDFEPPAVAGAPRPGHNLAVGAQALGAVTTGRGNTAVGHRALAANTGEFRNTAVGDAALAGPMEGGDNTAVGAGALGSGPVGANNTAVGSSAGGQGSFNTAVGTRTLEFSAGGNNVAVGVDALGENRVGDGNTAVGTAALRFATGTANIALGDGAGGALRDGVGNIYIGSSGPQPFSGANESGVIRIGEFQAATFVAGIVDTGLVDEFQVCVTSEGRLGTCATAGSSVHVKDKVAPIGRSSRRLLDLTPVSFRYRTGARGPTLPTQYGLLAEEVAGLYPELAQLDAEGTPVGVRYDVLPVLLLSEVQRQAGELRRQAGELERLAAELARLQALVEGEGPPARR